MMIEVGTLKASAGIDVVGTPLGDLSMCSASPCVGGDRIFGVVPPSVNLLEGAEWSDPTFSVTSQVLSADL